MYIHTHTYIIYTKHHNIHMICKRCTCHTYLAIAVHRMALPNGLEHHQQHTSAFSSFFFHHQISGFCQPGFRIIHDSIQRVPCKVSFTQFRIDKRYIMIHDASCDYSCHYIDQQPMAAKWVRQAAGTSIFSKTHAQVRINALPFKAVVIK